MGITEIKIIFLKRMYYFQTFFNFLWSINFPQFGEIWRG